MQENLQPPDEPRMVVCPDCHGRMGSIFQDSYGRDCDWIDCDTCHGKGEVIDEEK